MNLASWIILGILIVVLAFAVRATFFKKKPRGGCCDVGDRDARTAAQDAGQQLDYASLGCANCNGCGAATTAGALKPVYKDAPRE